MSRAEPPPADPPREALRGLIAAAHTPFNAQGRFNGAAVVRQYELFQEAGVAGVFVCGIEGEGHSLTLAERKAVLETWVGVTDSALPIIAHVGHSSIRDAIRLAEHAAKAGAAVIAAMAPSYYRPETLEELIEYLAAIAAAAPNTPFLFYDAPDFNRVRFATETVLDWGRLRIPSLAGVNFVSNDLKTLARCLEASEFEAVVGAEEAWLPALALGAVGAIGVTLGFAAPAYARIATAFAAGDLGLARAEHAKILELGRALQEFGFVRGSKAIMSMIGVDCGAVRPPIRPLHDGEFQALHERVRSLDLFARPLSPPTEIGR